MAIPDNEDGDFVPGIYNYCDRWCERCSMSVRCRQYAMECARDAFNADGSNDGDSAEFMEALMCFPDSEEDENQATDESAIAEATSFEVQEVYNDDDSDEFDDFDADAYMAERERIDQLAKATPCVKLADRYMTDARRWLDEWELLLDQIEEGEDQIEEARDVIGWYVFQIPTKLRRAINGKIRDQSYMIDDVNGSAKVVLIGVDNSLAAWKNLQLLLPEENQNAVDPLIELLNNLCQEIECDLPDARDFKRPGFDD